MSWSESTKQRALRIDLDHHKRPERLAVVKWTLAIVAALASVAYAAYVYLPGTGGNTQLSPGDLAAVHSGLNHRCAECHANFQAVHNDAWAMTSTAYHGLEEKCSKCHVAPEHHPISEHSVHAVESCSGCHQDHRGPEASLVRMGDEHCTRCHANLQDVVEQRRFTELEGPPIKSFATAHPEFRSLQGDDPGHLHFNHALHMRAGQTKEVTGTVLKKYSDVDPAFLDRATPGWRELTPAEQAQGVQLSCASCHEPRAGDDRLAFDVKDASRSTSHFQEMTYAEHCQACHELKIGPDAKEVVPHGLKQAELKQAIYALLLEKPTSPTPQTESGRYENRLLGKPQKELEGVKLLADSDARLRNVEKHLATTCAVCHSFQNSGTPLNSEVVPPDVPAFWFRSARFDHTAHRSMDCLACHEQAVTATKSTPIMIAGYESCKQCHSEAALHASEPGVQAARSDCVECHTYHGGSLSSHPRLGRAP